MISSIQFSDTQIWLIAAATFAAIVGIIAAFRWYLHRQSGSNLITKYKDQDARAPLEARAKYPEVDAFRYSNIIFKISLVIVLALVVVALNYTTVEDTVYIPENGLLLEEDIEIEPPRSDVKPPPPPPPPPTAITEVPPQTIPEDESPEFMDQSVTEETVVEAPVVRPSEEKTVAPPPPPPPPPAVEEIFKVVEEMPRFAGCEDMPTKAERKSCADQNLLKFIYSNIKYPVLARENNVQGTVVIQFVIDKDGKVKNAKIIRDIGGGCGAEALRVVNMMPDWIPGKQRGRAVNVQFNLPVRFELKGNQS